MPNGFSIVEFDAAEKSPSSKSNTLHLNLTEELACENLRAKVWYLDPGDALMHHKQRVQEELYVPLNGPGQIRLGDEVATAPEGAAVRVAPETPRQPVNESQQRQQWLIIGAPPADNDGVVIKDDD